MGERPRGYGDRSDPSPETVVRFVEHHLEEILQRQGLRMPPDARRELRLLQEAIAELAPRAKVIHVAWVMRTADRRAA